MRRPVIALLCAASFTALAVAVAAHLGPFDIDRAGVRVADGLQTGWLTIAMRTVSTLGSAPVIAATIVVVATAVLLARRDPLPGAWLVAEYVGAVVMYQILKAIIDRPRPAGALVDSTGSAFPSGHATQGVAFFGMLAVVLLAVVPGRTRLVAAAAAVLIGILSGLSRIYLEVHWLTDVTGGFLLGGAWLSVLLLLRTATDRRRSARRHPAGVDRERTGGPAPLDRRGD